MRLLPLVSLSLFVAVAIAGPTYTDPQTADDDFAYQGEYLGLIKDGEEEKKVGIQVIALGKGKFRAVVYHHGLPGDGWDNQSEKHTADGERKGDSVLFEKDGIAGTLKGGKMTITAGDKQIAELAKTERKSPTLAAKPPEGAVVLFDGS